MSKNKVLTYVNEKAMVELNEGDAILVLRANEDIEAFVWDDGSDMTNGAGVAVTTCAILCTDDDRINGLADELFDE